MKETNFMRVEDVAEELQISVSHAYKIIRQFNNEMKDQGFFTIPGRVNKQYFIERTNYNNKER